MAGDISDAGPILGDMAVSIHAHQFHGGRPAPPAAMPAALATFQSTPTNFMAGDTTDQPEPLQDRMFQSTPTNFMAGDRLRL